MYFKIFKDTLKFTKGIKDQVRNSFDWEDILSKNIGEVYKNRKKNIYNEETDPIHTFR